MGLLLDPTAYDLSTVDGQQTALQDIIDFQNNQFEMSQGIQNYQVSAYQQLNVALVNGNPTGVYSTPFLHGLGFAPVVLAFGLFGGNYNMLQYQEINFAPGGLASSYQYYTVDSQYVYYNVWARNLGGFFSTNNFSGAFYILNVPAMVG